MSSHLGYFSTLTHTHTHTNRFIALQEYEFLENLNHIEQLKAVSVHNTQKDS